TAQEVAEANTTHPSTGACKSPTTSSSENSTAAIGVLNAAAIAALAPMGMSAFTFSWLSPSQRPSTDASPAPTCTAGPSRPRGIPLASVAEVQKNFPSIVTRVIRPSRAYNAAFVCGTPLPRASGKYRYSRYPMPSELATGTSNLRHPIPPAGYSRAPNRSVSKMNATTVAPTSAPITSVSARNTCSSRSRKMPVQGRDQARNLLFAACALELMKVFPFSLLLFRIEVMEDLTALRAFLSALRLLPAPARRHPAGKTADPGLVPAALLLPNGALA